MKGLVWILILGAIGYGVYTLALKPLTGELGEVRSLEKVYSRAADRYIASVRQAGEPGLVVIADLDFAEGKIKEARQKAGELAETLREPKARERARALLSRIENFCKINQID